MNIDGCIKKIDKYLTKDNVQPCIVDVQTTADLSAVVTHYNVGTYKFIDVAEYCNDDEFPRIDALIDVLAHQECATFVTGMSSFLKLKGEQYLYNSIISSVDDYPEEFLPLAIRELGSNTDFCQGVLTYNKQFPYGIAQFISKALELEMVKEAQVIFTATAMNPIAKGKDIEGVIYSIISDCSTWEELETMERFKFNLLPIIKKMNSKRIQRLYPKFVEQVDQYISSVESSEEKYQYSRKYAWRVSCADGSEYDLDPLDYETEDEYNAAIHNEKYRWRRWHSEAKRYGIDVNAYETEDEYNEVLRKKREEEREARRIPKPQDDPMVTTDKTIYNFCSVVFNSTNQPYTYLTGDIEVKIGDTVVVPVGSEGKEVVATVVSISQHMRLTAPYPVDKAKKIIKKVEPAESEKGLSDE